MTIPKVDARVVAVLTPLQVDALLAAAALVNAYEFQKGEWPWPHISKEDLQAAAKVLRRNGCFGKSRSEM
jgi:hypothetical protein